MDQDTESHTFQTELRRAMLTAANRQRARLVDALRVAADEHVERARTRGAMESDGLRRLSEDDVETIQGWADAEMDRIGAEAARRTDELRRHLDDALERHGALVQAELDAVAEAVRAHHAALDAVFDDISAASDPAYIARRAKSVPSRLDLEATDANGIPEPDAADPSAMPDGPEPEPPPARASAVAVTDRAAMAAVGALRVAGDRAVEDPVDHASEISGDAEASGNVAMRLLRSIAGLGARARSARATSRGNRARRPSRRAGAPPRDIVAVTTCDARHARLADGLAATAARNPLVGDGRTTGTG